VFFGGKVKEGMDAVIYTRDDLEFEHIKTLIGNANRDCSVTRATLNGHKRYKIVYNLAVVAIEGAEGMEVVLEYSQRFKDTKIIWISSDPFFAGTALRNHIYDFIARPIDEGWLNHSIREALRVY